MGMALDKAGGDITAARINYALAIGRKARANLSNQPALNPHIGRKRCRASAVNDSTIYDQNIGHFNLL